VNIDRSQQFSIVRLFVLDFKLEFLARWFQARIVLARRLVARTLFFNQGSRGIGIWKEERK
jgi:hypothetical protein